MNELSQLICIPTSSERWRNLQTRLPAADGEPQSFAGTYGGIAEDGKAHAHSRRSGLPPRCSAGHGVSSRSPLCAYDESWLKFDALEGTAYFTTHALALVAAIRLRPSGARHFLLLHGSKTLTAKSNYIKYSDAVDVDYHRDYLRDKVSFLLAAGAAQVACS